MTKEEELGVKEAADELGVLYITALGYIHKGQLRGLRKGGKWKVPRSELERFKAEGNHPDSNKSEIEEGY